MRLKYPGRSQLNGHVRLIRAAETVKQAGGREWKQERDMGSKVKTDGVRSAQNWGQNSSIYPLVIGSKDWFTVIISQGSQAKQSRADRASASVAVP